MTYFGFLFRYLVLPGGALLLGLAWLRRGGRRLPDRLRGGSSLAAIALTAAIAVAYTTPWDNYLVASGVWDYDPELVAGVIIGYVPLEEYLFFVLQTALTGLVLILLGHRPSRPAPLSRWAGRARIGASLATGLLWLGACVALATDGPSTRYLALLLAWGLPPIVLQLAFGADLLWEERRLVVPALLLPTFFLTAADITAVSAGTWAFNPDLILGLSLGPLPLEEVAFFLVTNTLIAFGTTLLISKTSRARFRELVSRRGQAGPHPSRPSTPAAGHRPPVGDGETP